MEQLFEKLLWNTRYVLLLGVISCVVTAVVLILLGCYEVFHLAEGFYSHVFLRDDYVSRDSLVLYVIEILDTFLLSSILFIFAFGLYELFISSIQKYKGPNSSVFHISSIDELKAKLGNVIVMLIVVKLFSYLVEVQPENILEILYLSIVVLMVAISLWLGHSKHQK